METKENKPLTYFKGITTISYDTMDKFIYLSAESYSPSVAKDLVDVCFNN